MDFNIFPRDVKDKGIDILYELLEKREQYLCDYFNIYYVKMFTIEKSIFNTTCIAQMWDGQRINIGEATGSAEGDIAFLEKITGKGKQE